MREIIRVGGIVDGNRFLWGIIFCLYLSLKKKDKNEDRDWTGKFLMTDDRKMTGLITKK